MLQDKDVNNVLKQDGVNSIDIINFENITNLNINDLVQKFGSNTSWAVRTTYNDLFGGVLIHQLPGEGNRLHMHPDANECWFIHSGQWKWFIEGEGEKIVIPGSIVNVKKKTYHKITCVGKMPGIRFAITKPDVMHVYK